MIKLQKSDIELLRKVEELTLTDYEIKDDYINSDNLINALTELMSEYTHLKDEFRRLEQEIQDNYKAITKEEQIYG